jgi:hypothetical protein
MQNGQGKLSKAVEKSVFCKKFSCFKLLKKIRPLSGPFLTNQANIRPQTFPAPHNFFGPFVFCGRNFFPLATLDQCGIKPTQSVTVVMEVVKY